MRRLSGPVPYRALTSGTTPTQPIQHETAAVTPDFRADAIITRPEL